TAGAGPSRAQCARHDRVRRCARPERQGRRARHFIAVVTGVAIGFPFSTMYVTSTLVGPLATFFAQCTVFAGSENDSPFFNVFGDCPSTESSSAPSRM